MNWEAYRRVFHDSEGTNEDLQEMERVGLLAIDYYNGPSCNGGLCWGAHGERLRLVGAVYDQIEAPPRPVHEIWDAGPMNTQAIIRQFKEAARAIGENPSLFASDGMDLVLLGAALGVNDRLVGKADADVAACFADVAWCSEPKAAVDALVRRIQGA